MDSKGAEWDDQGGDTSNIRSTFESKMPSWDQSGDGVVDADDLLAAFDVDGDGTFDKSEIAQIAKQLNEQTELNSALLEQLTELEARQLKTQKELRTKQSQVQQAVDVAESARGEAADMKRQLTVAQEIAEKFTAEAREARVDVSSLTRANELLEKRLSGAQESLLDAKAAVKSAQSNDIEKDTLIDRLRATLRQQEDEQEAKAADMQNSYDALEEAHSALNGKHAPLELEVNSLRDAVRRLKAENQKLTSDAALHASRAEDAEGRAAALDKMGKQYKAMHEDAQSRHGEAEARTTAVTTELRKMKDLHATLQADAERREGDLAKKHAELEDTVAQKKSVEAEFHHLANDITASYRQRSSDQERYKAQIDELQEQLAQALESDRRRTQQYSREAQHMAADHLSQQKEKEEQYISLQDEHAELHMLLKTMQDKMQETTQQHEEERTQSRGKIREHQEAIRAKENTHVLEKGEVEAKVTKAQEEIDYLRREMSDRAKQYDETLGRLREDIKHLEEEAKRLASEKTELVQDFGIMKDYIAESEAANEKMLEDWHKAVQEGFDALIAENKTHKKSALDAEDKHRSEEMEKESIRAKSIMLLDKVDRLEHENEAEVLRRQNAEKEHEKHLEIAESEKERLRAQKADSDDRVRQMQQRLDTSTTQARTLQADAQKAKLELNSAQQKHGLQVAQMQEKVGILERKADETTRQRDEMVEKHSALIAKHSSVDEERQDLAQQLDSHKQLLQQASTQGKNSVQRQQALVQQRDVTLTKTKQQLDSTNQRLAHVREQVSELTAENDELRSQLSSIQAARLAQPPQPPHG